MIEVRPKENRALVRGVNMVRRHQRQSASAGRRHHFEGRSDQPLEHRARGPQGRQADPRRFQDPCRRQEGPHRKALGRADPGEELGHGKRRQQKAPSLRAARRRVARRRAAEEGEGRQEGRFGRSARARRAASGRLQAAHEVALRERRPRTLSKRSSATRTSCRSRVSRRS